MLETTLSLPRCDDFYKLHAWVSDRMGTHRSEKSPYVFVSLSAGENTVLSVIHDLPMKDISGAKPFSLPAEGTIVKFRSRLNPLRKQGMGKGKNKRRIPIESYEIKEWLQRQIDGATVESCEVASSGYEFFKKRKDKFSFWRMDVEGTLRINSTADLEKTILAGVGRMKGFGFGLIAIEGMMAFEILGL